MRERQAEGAGGGSEGDTGLEAVLAARAPIASHQDQRSVGQVRHAAHGETALPRRAALPVSKSAWAAEVQSPAQDLDRLM